VPVCRNLDAQGAERVEPNSFACNGGISGIGCGETQAFANVIISR